MLRARNSSFTLSGRTNLAGVLALALTRRNLEANLHRCKRKQRAEERGVHLALHILMEEERLVEDAGGVVYPRKVYFQQGEAERGGW